MTTVAEHLVEALVTAGVRRIYGVVGDSLNSIVDAVHHSKKIAWIHVRHEEVGAFAASAEAQLTGNLAVCAGSCGPGNLHLINGLFDAHKTLAPVLAIAAQIPSTEIGTDFFQETHRERLLLECSHFCQLVSIEKQMPRLLQIAMQTSMSRGGVSVLVLPGDVGSAKATSKELEHRIFPPHPAVRPSSADLKKLAEILNNSDRITLFGGAGCAGARKEVFALAERLKAPVAYSFRGKEFLEFDNPYATGMTGVLGTEGVHYSLEKADLVFLLGTDFPYTALYPKNAKIVQLDIRAEHLGRRSKLDLGLMGDTKETLSELLPLLKQKKNDKHLKACLEKERDTRKFLNRRQQDSKQAGPLSPEQVTSILSDVAEDDAIFTVDTGMTAVWAARHLQMKRERRLIGSFNHGSMANAMPQALGAQVSFPGRQVVTFSGDGGLSMLMGDLLSLRQHKLPVKIIVFSNSALAFVELEMLAAGILGQGTELVNPDFVALARSAGMFGVRVEDPADLKKAVTEAFQHDGPALIDAVVNRTELSMPQTIKLDQAVGFNLWALKAVLNGRGDEVIDLAVSHLVR